MSSDAESETGKAKLKVRDADAPSNKSSKSKSSKSGSSGTRSSGKHSSRSSDSGPESSWTKKLFALEDWGKWLLAIAILFSPWWFGSVGALPQFFLTGIIVVCLAIWLVKCFVQKETYRPHLVSMLVLIFLIVGLFQQTNLPPMLSGKLAKQQIKIRESLAGHLEGNHKELAQSLRGQTQIALNPSAARFQFSYFCLLSAVFLLGSRFFFRRREILILATLVAINGGAIAIFGAFQKVSNPNQIFGQTLEFGGVPFGPFVNRNNASGYLLMCLACGLAVLVYSFSTFHPKRHDGRSGLSKEGFWYACLRDLQATVAGLNVSRIGLIVLCGCIGTGIFISLSRGGMIALCVSVAVFALYLFRMKSRRGMILLILFLIPAAGVTLLVSGMNETVGKRLETLNEDDLLSRELRVRLWRDSLQSVADYPIMGSGVGSYPYVYKEYQTFVDTKWCFHAENVFVEILVTFGITGAILMTIGLLNSLLFIRSLSRSSSDSRNASPKSVAIGGLMLFIVVSQSVSNFFDFGFLIPSNGILFVTLMGALTGAWCTRIENDKRNNPRRLSRMPRWTTVPIVVVVALLAARSGQDFWYEHKTETANLAARTNDVNEYSKAEVDALIAKLESVLDQRPNLQTHEYLAKLYVIRLQHEFVDQQIKDYQVSNPDVQLDRKVVWERSTLRVLNFQLAGMSESDRKLQVEKLMAYDFFQSNVKAANLQYMRALDACPLSVRSLIGMAELSFLNQLEIEPYLAAIDEYNIRSPAHLMRIGDAAVSHGLKSVATKYWNRAIVADEELSEVIVRSGIFFLNEDQVREDLLPPRAPLLDKVAEQYYSGGNQVDAREKIYYRIVGILSADVYSDADSNYLLGKAYMETGNIISAIKSYETATMLARLDVRWKAELAELYFRVGRVNDAIATIKKCLAVSPDNEKYQQMLSRFESY